MDLGRRIALGIGALLLLAILLNPPEPHVGATIELTPQGPVPRQVSVAQGEVVVFKNTDTMPHWPAADFHPTHSLYPESDARKCDTLERTLLFDACDPIPPGEHYVFRFTQVGEWPFHDHLAPQHEGNVLVRAQVGYTEPIGYVIDAWWRRLPSEIANFTSSMIGHILGVGYRMAGTLPPAPIYGPYGADDLISLRDYTDVKVLSLIADDREVLRMLSQLGVKTVLDKIVRESGGESNPECHLAAHVVGRQAFNLYGVEGLGSCNLSCHAGCYHGAMEEIATASDATELLSSVGTLCSSFDTVFGRYQCFHGVGHGFLLYATSDVPAALNACRSVGDSAARDACFGGVFMENIFGDGLTSNPDAPWTPKPGNLHFPCNAIEGDTNTIRWCYELQSEYILLALHRDYDRARDECLAAPATVTDVCFKSLGRLHVAENPTGAKELEAMCTRMPEEYQDDCILGGAKYAIDFPGPDSEGKAVAFCKGLEGDDAKRVCYARYTQSLNEMFVEREVRDNVCRMFETPYDRTCIEQQK